jgi:uncharacterized membrane protein
MRESLRSSPAAIFAFLAALGGLILVMLIPPMAGGNETFNFHRAAAVASGHWLIEPASVPAGIVRFIHVSDAAFPEGAQPPYSYSRAQFEALAAIPLAAGEPAILQPNPIAVLHPFSYLPQVPVLWLGQLLGLPPLLLFYLGRIAGLAAGIALTFLAIRAIPVHKHALAAIALLPTILFSRSTFDADQLTNGLAFLFLAMVMREIAGEGRIRAGALAGMAAAAFILAQCKSAYLLLPFFALAIPSARFGSVGAKLAACAVIALPGIAASAAWMIALKQTYFQGIHYRTWSGEVFPDRQTALILADPLSYAAVLLRTFFLTPLIRDTLVGLIGVFGPPVRMPPFFYPALTVALASVFVAEPRFAPGALQAWPTRLLAAFLFLTAAVIVLTLLYLQWNRLGAPVVEGFQGRYLYPLIPLVLVLLPSGGRRAFGLDAPAWLALLGALGVGGTWYVTWSTYLA